MSQTMDSLQFLRSPAWPMVLPNDSACRTSRPRLLVSSNNYILLGVRLTASVRVDVVSQRCCAVPLDCQQVWWHLSRAVVGGSNYWSVPWAGAVKSGSTWPGTWWETVLPTYPWHSRRLTCNHLYSRSCTPLLMCCGMTNLKNLLSSSLNSAMGRSNCCLRLLPHISNSLSMLAGCTVAWK